MRTGIFCLKCSEIRRRLAPIESPFFRFLVRPLAENCKSAADVLPFAVYRNVCQRNGVEAVQLKADNVRLDERE